VTERITDLDHARYDRDRWMDDAMKAQQRLIEVSADLAAEKQCARLNAECHTREIRALQDMVEAEAEARREAEGEVERLRAYAREVGTALVRLTCDGSEFYRKAGDIFEVDPAACSAWVRRSRQTKHETIVRLTQQKNDLLDTVAGWKRVAVEAAIPLEAMRMARPASDFSPDMQQGIEHAISIIRRAVVGEGLPPAPPPVPSSSKE